MRTGRSGHGSGGSGPKWSARPRPAFSAVSSVKSARSGILPWLFRTRYKVLFDDVLLFSANKKKFSL